MPKSKLESEFQGNLVKDLKVLLPGCIILKNDANYQQGIPDLLILWQDRWALLECKKSDHEKPRPNQPYFVAKADRMSFGAFIYPENREEIIDQLQEHFGA